MPEGQDDAPSSTSCRWLGCTTPPDLPSWKGASAGQLRTRVKNESDDGEPDVRHPESCAAEQVPDSACGQADDRHRWAQPAEPEGTVDLSPLDRMHTVHQRDGCTEDDEEERERDRDVRASHPQYTAFALS